MKKDNLIGRKFGRLLVIAEMPAKRESSKRPSWKCLCDCGTEIIVDAGGDLKRTGKRTPTQSCGCLARELAAIKATGNTYSQKYENREISIAHIVYEDYVRSDTSNNDILSFDQFYNLSQKNCTYCGIAPSNIRQDPRNKLQKNIDKGIIYNNPFIYNGIDRVNNDRTIGHIFENCVPCCRECNSSKRDMTLDQFYDKVNRIVLYKKDTIPDYQTLFTSFTGDLSHIAKIKRHLKHYNDRNFSADLLYFILIQDCFYCNERCEDGNSCKVRRDNGIDFVLRNGIDKLDQSPGKTHTLDNIVACCASCNFSKLKRSSSEFIAWAERVVAHQNYKDQKEAPISHQETSTHITLVA